MIYQLNLSGIEEEFKEFYRHILEGLLDQVPEDASVSSTIRKVDTRYAGMLNIFSFGGRFVAKSLGKSPQETVNSLVKQIQDQIREWRRNRFPTEDMASWNLVKSSKFPGRPIYG